MRLKAIVKGINNLAALAVVAALIAPLAGPVFDHHFAERQPDHLHFGAPGEHSHAFESAPHIHRRPSTAAQERDYPIVLYKSEGSIAATLAASPVNVEAASMHRYQPTSVLVLPPSVITAARQHIPHPPDRPPAPLPQRLVGFPSYPLCAA